MNLRLRLVRYFVRIRRFIFDADLLSSINVCQLCWGSFDDVAFRCLSVSVFRAADTNTQEHECQLRRW